MGLHALQDVEAHEDLVFVPGHAHSKKFDNVNYVWKDDTRTSVKRAVCFGRVSCEQQTRLNDTKTATVNYLTEFLDKTKGMDVRSIFLLDSFR